MKRLLLVKVAVLGALLAGCSSNKELLAQQQAEITSLQGKLKNLENRLAEETARAERLDGELHTALASYEEKEQVLLDQIAEKSIVTVSDDALFGSGSVKLTSGGEDILAKIADVVDTYPDREILVEGHTDNKQIKPEFQATYPTNWELSSARAHSALHYLRNQFNVPPERMAAVGYGEHRPVADNGTTDGRAANRRVVIVIGPVMEQYQSDTAETPKTEPIP